MVVDLSRERRPPRGFGWVDRRVVTDGHLMRMGQVHVVVYLFLCVVADRQGVSWYHPKTLAQHVQHPADRVRQALDALANQGLIAVQGRYIQVLDLVEVQHEQDPAQSEKGPGSDREPDPAQTESAAVSAHEFLERLSPEQRERALALARAQISRIAGSRPPSTASLEAVAAGLVRQGEA